MSEADLSNFDIFKPFEVKKPKKGKQPNAAREKATLENLKRSIEEDKGKLDAKLAAKGTCSSLSLPCLGCSWWWWW